MRRDVFQAIADPTRRAIIDLLAGKSLNLNAVAENFDISRPAISKHIKILTECGVVVVKQSGRERYCEVNLASLREVSKWVKQYKAFWTKKPDALEQYLAQDKLSSSEGITSKKNAHRKTSSKTKHAHKHKK
jgi:DNA-binding transcriptional ArsR family regulator